VGLPIVKLHRLYAEKGAKGRRVGQAFRSVWPVSKEIVVRGAL